MEGSSDSGDPSQQFEDMGIVIGSLFDTFMKYLNPEAIIDNCSLIDGQKDKFFSNQSSRVDVLQNLLHWVQDDDHALSFTETLSKLNADEEVTVHPAISGGTDDEKLQMSQNMKHLVQTIDGSLTKKLTRDDVKSILDSMLEKRLITKVDHQRAKNIESPHKCCLDIFRSIRRGIPNWPLGFFDAVKNIRPDLVMLQANESPHIYQSPTLALSDAVGYINSQNGAMMINQYASSENSFNDDDFDQRSKPSLPDFEDRQKRSSAKFHISEEDRLSLPWQLAIESGAVDESSISTEPPDQPRQRQQPNRCSFSDEEDLSDEQSVDPEDGKETPELSLREYQHELAENALKGRNTVICAPTGSGKTRVAIHIILNHLQKLKEKKSVGKVAFLARTVPLVMQQHKSLKKYLPRTFEVTHLTGDSEDSMHLHMLLADNDVIVMTPRILENHLKRNCLPHLGVFTMLVFDECHHTRKGEPYNTLMYSYLKTKYTDTDVKLPQIVGLTASISVEKAVQDEEAVKCILQVLGNLDAESISSVEKYEDELKSLVPVPEEKMFKLRERENDEAVDKIIRIMLKLEQNASHHAKEVNHDELIAFLRKIPSDKKSQQYGQWAVKLRGVARSLPREEHRETNNSVRSLIIITDYLVAYSVALELHDLVQLKDVMAYLKRCFEKYIENESRTSGEDTYFAYFKELQAVVKGRLEVENPNLTILKEKLLEYLVAKGEKSCGIIFVRTRALTDALTSWLERCGDDNLKGLKATVFTGTAASVEQGGMTTAEQDEVIRRFRSGEVRLLVATSVGEEGLDIPECNLVIKYNHVGNEVTTVQTRGRSRKEGGMSILLAMDKILRKERINQEKAKMMTRAIKQIRQMKRSKIRKMNQEHQSQIMKDEEIHEIVRQQEESRLQKKPFKLVCQLCRKVVIDCADIKTIFKTHRVVVDSKILKQIKTSPYKESKYLDEIKMIGSVRCKGEPEEGKHCNNKLGSMLIFSKVPFVVLGIKSFGFDTNSPLGLEFYNQWKKVPYVIDEIQPQDFERYLPKKKEPEKQDDDDETGSDTESDGSNGDDDDKGNRHHGKEGSVDEGLGTIPDGQNMAQEESHVLDSMTQLKKTAYAREGHDGENGGQTSLTEAKEAQQTVDSGVYSDRALSSGSSDGFPPHSTQVKDPTYGDLPNQQENIAGGLAQQSVSVSSFNSGATYHDTPAMPMSKVNQSVFRIRQHELQKDAGKVLGSGPPLSSKFSSMDVASRINIRAKSLQPQELSEDHWEVLSSKLSSIHTIDDKSSMQSLQMSETSSSSSSESRNGNNLPAQASEHAIARHEGISRPAAIPPEVNENSPRPERLRGADGSSSSPARLASHAGDRDNTSPKEVVEEGDSGQLGVSEGIQNNRQPRIDDNRGNQGSHSSQGPGGLSLL